MRPSHEYSHAQKVFHTMTACSRDKSTKSIIHIFRGSVWVMSRTIDPRPDHILSFLCGCAGWDLCKHFSVQHLPREYQTDQPLVIAHERVMLQGFLRQIGCRRRQVETPTVRLAFIAGAGRSVQRPGRVSEPSSKPTIEICTAAPSSTHVLVRPLLHEDVAGFLDVRATPCGWIAEPRIPCVASRPARLVVFPASICPLRSCRTSSSNQVSLKPGTLPAYCHRTAYPFILRSRSAQCFAERHAFRPKTAGCPR